MDLHGSQPRAAVDAAVAEAVWLTKVRQRCILWTEQNSDLTLTPAHQAFLPVQRPNHNFIQASLKN